MSFQQALSGLNASSKTLEVIGNNIANSATYGYKSSRTEFADVYAASLNGASGAASGIGVNLAAISQQFTQGPITATDNPMDLAINGDGFFQVGDGITPPSYTRNGQFKVVQGQGADSDKKFISDNNGLYLLGIPAGQTTPGPLSLPTGRIEANQTSIITLEVNLQSNDKLPTGGPITTVEDLTIQDDSKPKINYTVSQSLFDGKGQPVSVTYYFRKLAADDPYADGGVHDAWSVYMTANGIVVPSPGEGEVQPAFIANFDKKGVIAGFVDPANMGAGMAPDPPPGLTIPVTTDPKTGALSEPIDPLTFRLGGMSQLAASYGATKVSQDGYASGELRAFSIDGGGVITAKYSNGQSAPAGQIQLARFVNSQGLRPMGGNLWASTVDSGAATVNNPSQGGTGDLSQGGLEESNVDLTAELVNMITAQRAYQANAQTIKTMDQVMQTIVNLR